MVEAGVKDVSETTAVHILDEEPEALFEVVAVVVFDDVFMVADGHQCDLIGDGFLLTLRLCLRNEL